jgi:hypothetical protein
MKLAIFLVVLLFLGVNWIVWATFGVMRRSLHGTPTLLVRERQQLESKELAREWYKELLAEARFQGSWEVIVPGTMESRSKPLTLEDVLNEYCILRVRVTAKETLVSREAHDIVTWYKLNVVETLHPQQKHDTTPLNEDDVPIVLLPLAPSECLFPVLAGTVVIDDIRLVRATQYGQFPVEVDREYVMAALLENGGKVLIPAGNGAAVFELSADLSLRALTHPARQLTQDLLNRNVDTLDRLRAEISSRQSMSR